MMFIKTNDAPTKQKLIDEGFVLVNESGGFATFLNDKQKKTNFDDKKVVLTDKLEI